MNKAVFEFTDDNFENEVLGSGTTTLVDFWATWCGPCKTIGPIIEELADELNGKIKIGKVNIDENPNVTNSLDILNIPTLVFFKDGRETARLVGINSKADILKKIQEL